MRVQHLRRLGWVGVRRALSGRLRALFGVRARCHPACVAWLRERTGMEVGGPSPVFSARGMFPVYPLAARIDNANFSHSTVWEGELRDGQPFVFDAGRAPGTQYVLEATDLCPIASASRDFVLASHVLEHVADPLRALLEWQRLLRAGGVLVFVVPDRRYTFDHRRPVTSLDHLLEDHARGVGEDDLTHLPEILALHDRERDPEAGDEASFRDRAARNHQNRCLHHHVFDADLARALVERAGLQLVALEEVPPMHILVVARKVHRSQS